MTKVATIALLEGSCDRGFLVLLEIAHEGKNPSCKISGKLPPAPSIAIDYQKWQLAYRNLLDWSISNKRAQLSEVLELSDRLSTGINDWLNSDPFGPIREKLLENIAANEELRVVIRSDNDIIPRLPWNCWNLLCDRHPQVEIAVCDLHCDRLPSLPKTNSMGRPVRILAVFGNSTQINIEADRKIIKQLPNAQVCYLTHPKVHDLNYRLSKQPWDIFFFAGHSYTKDNTGYLCINQTDHVAIGELEAGFKNAISQGLTISICNSCDGIGLAKALLEWKLPQALVMRDIVPDYVARVYLNSFLQAYSGGKSLYASVAEARSHLLEDPLICASWLPVIFQNPSAVPTTWDEFNRQK